jgi:tetratricopeptide (TPR) repeat protein
VKDLLRQALDALVLVGAVCGLLLFAAAVIGFVAAVFRVTALGRVLVLPFRGSDERRVDLTALFVRRLMDIEGEWTAFAAQIQALKHEFEVQSAPTQLVETQESSDSALADGRPLDVRDPDPSAVLSAVGAGPRTTGDDFLDDIFLLEGGGSIATADLGVVSVAGVSFSPQTIIALLRALPAVFARRVLTGSMVTFGARTLVTVTYEERWPRRSGRTARCSAEVEGDTWPEAIEDLAFQLAKGRIDLFRGRGRHGREGRSAAVRTSASVMADRAVVEATSWRASRAFLTGYVSHLRHYVSGSAADRDRALGCYATALEAQPGYTRAAYHRATLQYNRYLPAANEDALAGFGLATASDDGRLRALAHAGLAMAFCQRVQRFGHDAEAVLPQAWQASEDAIKIEPGLEEARLAQGWTRQIREDFETAIELYDRLAGAAGDAPPARRIASFALNNAGWIWLDPLRERDDALLSAERRLWQAVRIYPNKIAYGNLAEIARRYRRYDDARALFDVALALDPDYVSGWNERACLEIEIAAASEGSAAEDALTAAEAHHARALGLASDKQYAERLRSAYETSRRSHGLANEANAQLT